MKYTGNQLCHVLNVTNALHIPAHDFECYNSANVAGYDVQCDRVVLGDEKFPRGVRKRGR